MQAGDHHERAASRTLDQALKPMGTRPDYHHAVFCFARVYLTTLLKEVSGPISSPISG